MAQPWKPGRGKLGGFAPLIGTWRATADSEMGPVSCERTFTLILGSKFVQLDAGWRFGANATRGYDERCIFGPDKDGIVSFWSFTSDGKRSQGRFADAADIHPKALCFEAQMDAGLARQVYWPDEDKGVRWVVESKTKKGWRRFVEHLYQPL
jgi:hypothetical protein